MSFLGSLVGGVLGLFGSKKKTEKTVTESVVDYAKMRDNAAAAGFNPLTAIRNGGSAGFTTSTTTSPTTSQLPGALQSIGGALGDALSDRFDPLARKQRQYDTALVDYQLRQLKEGPKAKSGTLYPGGQFLGTKVRNATPTMAEKGKSFIGPAMPEHLALGIGKKMPLFVWGVDDNGKKHRIANPDLPDLDQVFVPSASVVASEATAGKDSLPAWWDSITYQVRKRMSGSLGYTPVLPRSRSARKLTYSDRGPAGR